MRAPSRDTPLVLLIIAFACRLARPAAALSSATLPAVCPSTSYFDVAALSCLPCGPGANLVGANATSGTDAMIVGGARVCACASGFIVGAPPACSTASLAGCAAPTCGTSCAAVGLAVSARNASTCLPCGASTLGFSALTNECACFAGTSGSYALVEAGPGGAPLTSKECAPCAPRARVFVTAVGGRPAAAGTCQACADAAATLDATGACACDAGFRPAGLAALAGPAGVACLPAAAAAPVLAAYPEAAGSAMAFWSLDGGGGATATRTSVWAAHTFASAAVRCAGATEPPVGTVGAAARAGCHALLNVCVVALYDPAHPACALAAALAAARSGGGAGGAHGFVAWPAAGGAPMVSYAAADVSGADPGGAGGTALSRAMAFVTADGGDGGAGDPRAPSGATAALPLFLAAYAMDGSFLSLTRLGSQLQYCGGGGGGGGGAAGGAPWADSPPWLRFGVAASSSVTCDIAALVPPAVAAPGDVRAVPVFYELFVRDVATDAAATAAAAAASASSGAGAASAAAAASPLLPSGGAPAPLPLSLLPVPVRIVNLRTADGGQPNVNHASADAANDVYVRRFMLVDAAAGAVAIGAPPDIIRYAVRLTLTVPTRAGSGAGSSAGSGGDGSGAPPPSLLGTPVLEIAYRERRVADMLSGAVPTTDTVTWAVEYTAPPRGYAATVTALAATLGVGVALAAAVRTVGWRRQNVRTALEAAGGPAAAAQFVVAAAGAFARAFFWLLWAACAYWLVFFKLQAAGAVFVVLPTPRAWDATDGYRAFAAGLAAVAVCHAARVASAVWRQSSAELFFVDWERPRLAAFTIGGGGGGGGGGGVNTGDGWADGDGGAPSPSGGGATHRSIAKAPLHAAAAAGSYATAGSTGAAGATSFAAMHGGGPRYAPVSVWRTLFAAGEWTRVATTRRTTAALTLGALAALLQGAGLRYVAAARPDRTDLSPGPLNPALQFAHTVAWFWLLAAAQVLWSWAVWHRFVRPDPLTRFLDLCAVAKVSLLALDARYHGFYLHCNAPHEHAEGDMRELSERLAEEAAALRSGRGMPGCPDPAAVAFELHLPAAWRAAYDGMYGTAREAETRAVDDALAAAAALGGAGGAVNAKAAAAAAGAVLGRDGDSGGAGGGAFVRTRERVRRLHAASLALAGFLRAFVEDADPAFKRVWRERTLAQAVLDLPPDLITEGVAWESAVAMHQRAATAAADGAHVGAPGGGAAGGGQQPTYVSIDRRGRWVTALTFRGIEYDLLTLELLVFAGVDYRMDAPVCAALAAWAVSAAVAAARTWLGRRAMAHATLIDERFLG